MPFVIDASVTLAWCLGDEQSDYAHAIFSRMRIERAKAPSLWPIEIANGLRNAERRRRVSAAGILETYSLLASLPLDIEEASLDRALGPVLALARQHDLSAYDASYLELAMREGLPLASLDDRLRGAALAAGVSLAE